MGGVISPGGVYTAPASPGTYHVIAASHTDAGRSTAANLLLTSAGPITLSKQLKEFVIASTDPTLNPASRGSKEEQGPASQNVVATETETGGWRVRPRRGYRGAAIDA